MKPFKRILILQVIYFFFLSIILLSPLLRIRLCVIRSSRIGHLLFEIFQYLLTKRKVNIFDIFIPYKPQISNKFLYKQIKKKKLFFLENLSAYIIFEVHKLFVKYKLYNYILKLDTFLSFSQWKNLHKKINLINFNKDLTLRCVNLLKKNNIKLKKKIMCICTRDNYYSGTILQNEKNYKISDPKNSKIKNYKKTILYLLNNGFQVFRMGEHHKNDLNIYHKNFIDYSTLIHKNDILDFYLVSKSKFVISNSSGWMGIACYFNKDIILSDITDLPYINFGYPFYIIFKKIISVKKNKKMRLQEAIKKNYYLDYRKYNILRNEILIKDNTPHEILNLTKQYLSKKLKKKKIEDIKLEKKAKEVIIESLKTLESSKKSGLLKKMQRYVLDEQIIDALSNLNTNKKNIQWIFGTDYLRKNF